MNLQIECHPSYPKDCKIVFVGEAPGREEVEQRTGFVGSAGKCLQKAAKVAGLVWGECGRSNVAKRRPKDNKFREEFYETIEESTYTKTGKLSKKTKKVVQKTEELREWENLLFHELREQHPNLVVACGNEALESLTGVSGITNYRGSILEDAHGIGLKILAVEHPSYIIRGNSTDFWILARDLQKAKREMEFPEIRREPINTRIKPTFEQVLRCLRDMRLGGKWTLDVETRSGTLACFAVAREFPDGIYSLCVPIQTATGPYWSVKEEYEIWKVLRETLRANPNLCNQNIEYDIDYLLRYGCEPSGVLVDTMLLHSILYPEFPKDLGFLGSFYLDDIVYWKQDHRDWSSRTPDEALWEYNCKDAIYTLRIVDAQIKEAKRRGMWEMYHGRTI